MIRRYYCLAAPKLVLCHHAAAAFVLFLSTFVNGSWRWGGWTRCAVGVDFAEAKKEVWDGRLLGQPGLQGAGGGGVVGREFELGDR
jgi:hypothetical protein